MADKDLVTFYDKLVEAGVITGPRQIDHDNKEIIFWTSYISLDDLKDIGKIAKELGIDYDLSIEPDYDEEMEEEILKVVIQIIEEQKRGDWE